MDTYRGSGAGGDRGYRGRLRRLRHRKMDCRFLPLSRKWREDLKVTVLLILVALILALIALHDVAEVRPPI